MKKAIPVLVLSFLLTIFGALSTLEGWSYARILLIAGIVLWVWGMVLVFRKNSKSMPVVPLDKSE